MKSIVMGCKYCGRLYEEGMGKKARASNCCQKCYIERFGGEPIEKEEKVDVVKPSVPGRVDSDKVKIKKVVWD